MTARLSPEAAASLRARIGYLRDLGVHDFYRRAVAPVLQEAVPAGMVAVPLPAEAPTPVEVTPAILHANIEDTPIAPRKTAVPPSLPPVLPPTILPPAERAAALEALRLEIGDCTRCPLGFAGRHKVVFGDGDPNARLMFVGEGPGADEDAQGVPFVGKAGQLLNNMITAMGLKREQVYIGNIVKCRPPANRVPEPVEANTCVRFLQDQIGIVRPEIIVALGSTAATYLLGGKSPLSALRGRLHEVYGAQLVVTYHPAYLLRDPRQKKEAWADLQMVMRELAASAG